MIESILNDVLSWAASLITTIFDALSGGMLETLKPDISVMTAYFPFLEAAQKAMVYMGYSLLFLIVVWQLFRSFAGPLADSENPMRLIAKSVLSAFFIGFSSEVFDILLRITLVPYKYLLDDVVIDKSSFSFASLGDTVNEGLAVNFVSQAGAAAVDLAAGSAVFVFIWIIILVIIGWNYIKLLLEAVERYVMIGVLYFTSPLAFASGASQSTAQIFKSWCRMVASELILLIMNVWFIRGFNAAIGKALVSGGILESGGGNMYLCIFMLVGFLHIGQHMDKFLATLGMNTAQAGQGLVGDVIVASRFAFGAAAGASAGSVFRNKGNHISGQDSNIPSSYKPSIGDNLSFERAKADVLRTGGVSRGGSGPLAFAQKTGARIAVKNGAEISPSAISDVANMRRSESGVMKGEALDRSVSGFIPSLEGYSLKGTQVEGGHIKTRATGSSGKSSEVELFSKDIYEAPEGAYSIVSDSDQNQWYQTAKGEGAGDFYDGPSFSGEDSELPLIREEFPQNTEIGMLRDVEPGVKEETDTDGAMHMMYNSAYFDEPDAPFNTVSSKDGVEWYSVSMPASVPSFERNDTDAVEEKRESGTMKIQSDVSSDFENAADNSENSSIIRDLQSSAYVSAPSADTAQSDSGYIKNETEALSLNNAETAGYAAVSEDNTVLNTDLLHEEVSEGKNTDREENRAHEYSASQSGIIHSQVSDGGISSVSKASDSRALKEGVYAQKVFREFMPGYDKAVSGINGSMRSENQFEVMNSDGSAVKFYDSAVYKPPKGNYRVYEDADKHQWIAVQGEKNIEIKPVYKNGKLQYENGNIVTVKKETIQYHNEALKYDLPRKRQEGKTGNNSDKKPQKKR